MSKPKSGMSHAVGGKLTEAQKLRWARNKVKHLEALYADVGSMPQHQAERYARARAMLVAHAIRSS